MRFIPLALLGTLLLAGCGSDPTPPPAASIERNMEISVDLHELHRCSRISPEIEIAEPPKGTTSFEVVLEDVDDNNRNHGGGVWQPEHISEDAIIVEGALTKYYTGPCPPADQSRVYQYVVKALDVNKQLLGVGKYTFLQE